MIVDMADRLSSLKGIFPFSTLSDGELQKILPFFDRIELLEGTAVFSDGYPAEELFFILSGTVKLILHHKKKDEILGLYCEGDHFGDESLMGGKVFQTRAICTSNVVLLRLRSKKAQTIAEWHPQIHNAFSLFQRTFHLAVTQKLTWRNPEESIELFSRRHPFFLSLRLLAVGGLTLFAFSFLLFSALASQNSFGLLLALSLVALIAGSGLCAWAGLEWSNDYFILTRERVAVQKKLIGFYDRRHESPVNAILSVGIDTSFLGRLLGYGTVTVRTYTGDLHFERLPFPYLIYEILEFHRQQTQNRENQAEKRQIRDALTASNDVSLHQKSSQAKAKPDKAYNQISQSNSLSDTLARFFNLRSQNENSVLYRTHWWVLVRKTFLPGLFLLAVVVTVALRALGFLSVLPDVTVYVFGILLSLVGWGWWIYQYQDWHNDVYILTDDQLIDVYKKPLGTEDRKSAPVKNIQTVEYERKGLINLVLNFGTVKIKIGNEELSFDNVYQPSEVQGEIYALYRAYLEKAKKNDQQRFVEWIKTYDQVKMERNSPDSQSEDEEKG